jgi:ATP-dependent helicase/nuclease subunit A
MLPARDIYDRLRRENNQLNFQDLLLKAVELLRDKPQIRHYFRKRFTHLLVDEFQDTDPIQAEVMLLLTATDVQEINWQKCRPVDGSLFVVGDPKQSIYRFRRADIVTYTKVKRIISDAGGLIVPLSANFRTVEPVIDWINSKFQGTFPEKATNYSPERHALQPGRTDGEQADLLGIRQLQIPAEESSSEVRVAQYESELIARTIRHALDSGLTVPRTDREREAGVPPQARPEDFLIIARTKKRLSLYGQKLQEYGIPHQVTGGSTVNEVGELQLLNLCLRAITRPDDQVALLAALRSQLFGISDVALYDFKRAGGVFSFQVPVPDQTPAEAKALFADAFARLQQYARWLAKLPSISAIEKITADLGLWAFSCTGIDGSLQAGSLGKGLELLRDASHAGAVMAADLVELLGKIIDQDQSHDGLPALPEQDSPVRVMNLHQAKGLEAAVVFLVYPNGPGPFGPEIHIDRTGDRALGYLMIMGEAGERRQRPILAHPVGWDGFSQEEDAFLKAENDRLLYVAATRAGSQLTISQRTQRNDSNPWLPFQEAIRGCPNADLPDSPVSRPKPTRIVPLGDVANAAADTVTRWEKVSAVSYGVVSAKDWALSGPVPKKPRSAGEHGTEWGTVIHTLLEAAVSRPHSDLRNLALSSLIEQDLDPNLADTAVETVQAITRSELWTRVQASSKKFVEIPFETLISNPESPTPVPTLMRGVIDLVFREKPGWVIVDYKTEQVPEESLAELASHYSSQIHTYARVWEQMVGEAIHETGIFFTHSRQYYRYVS